MDDLIERWIAGDAEAAAELYERYRFRVREFVITLGAKLFDADDLSQEAMVAGLEGLKDGKRPERLTHWLLGISRNLYFKKSRRGLAHLTDAVDPSMRGARTLAVRREMKGLLDRTLEDLPRKDRKILELLHRKGCSRKEVAAKLGVSQDAIHARCERLHDRLREELSRHLTTAALAQVERPPVSLADINALRPAFRAVLTARHLEGLTDVQASAKLAIPEATLRARLRSAYEMLKRDADDDFSLARREYEEGGKKGEVKREERG
jgi:RNA polymerase sigma-70 factor (ECF subfamily)